MSVKLILTKESDGRKCRNFMTFKHSAATHLIGFVTIKHSAATHLIKH